VFDDEVAEIDHLVLRRGGMVLIESRNVTGEVHVNEHGEWMRCAGSLYPWPDGTIRFGPRGSSQAARLVHSATLPVSRAFVAQGCSCRLLRTSIEDAYRDHTRLDRGRAMRQATRHEPTFLRVMLLGSVAALWALSILAGPASAALEVSTYAGKANVIGAANGDRLAARFKGPGGIALDAYGNKYIADTQNHVIRRISPTGVVSTFAGKAGVIGSADGKGGSARFSYPVDVDVDSQGNVYVADTGNNTIRRIRPSGLVTTVAGTAGVTGSKDGLGTVALFDYPAAIAVDKGTGSVYVADRLNHTIRAIVTDGQAIVWHVSTIAGKAGVKGSADGAGSVARFNEPMGIAATTQGGTLLVYVADQGNSTIRKLSYWVVNSTDWEVETIAGKAGVPGSADGLDARFSVPMGLALDGPETLYVADFANNTIRKVVRLGILVGQAWAVYTVAGAPGQSGTADGSTNAARFGHPMDVALHPAGALYVADTYNSTIRRIATLPTFSQFVGPDRYATAILVSKAAYPGTAPAVVLAKGDDFPDALAAAPLARAYNGPVILTPSGGLTQAVRNEFLRLKPKTVLFVGLPTKVRDQVQALLPTAQVKSFVGTDRYHTATLLAEELKTKKGSVPWVVLVPGDTFPDALSVAPLAARKGWAILLTPQGGPLPTVTRNEIQGLGVTRVLRVGTWVSPPASVTQVVSKVGTDRYQTSALVAAWGDSMGLSYDHLAVATGENFPDALVVGPYLAKDAGILLLTHPTSLPAPIRTELVINRDWVAQVDFPGLPAGMIAVVKGVLE